MKQCVLNLAGLFCVFYSFAQQPLTVEKIMRDSKWMGTAPLNPFWSIDSRTVYFSWNPEKALGDSLYKVTLPGGAPVKVAKQDRPTLPAFNSDVTYNKSRTKAVYEKDGDLFIYNLATKKITQFTNTLSVEVEPRFSKDEKKIFYVCGMNLYSVELATGITVQLTDIRKGKKAAAEPLSDHEKWLRNDQLEHFDVLKERDRKQSAANRIRKSEVLARPTEFYVDEKSVEQVRMSPNERYITFRLTKSGKPKSTIIPGYVTPSGFTEDLNGRPKVGAPSNTQELFLYDIVSDTIVQISANELPGMYDKVPLGKPAAGDKKPEARKVSFAQVSWSENGAYAAVLVRTVDNKDRWIALLDAATRKLTSLDRLHDDAWILGWPFATTSQGWLDENQIWFVSEETGYAHLYVLNVHTGKKRALTSGNYEVQRAELPGSKKYFYITTNEVHPGEKHLYRVPVAGGKAEKLTTMTGAHEVVISPDEKNIVFRYSYINKPWELYIMENKPGAKPVQVTSSLTDEFKAYPWREPELVTFKARDGASVYARLYKPANPNGAAVVFVHGAGYLQNAHKWWSSYYHEYMFHNLLADKGYTVLDADYRASAGYGRDWRTGIYQFMGGKDLTDNIDGAKYLVENYGVDAKRIGIYGGSYGGFITLMGMFTTPDVFASGAALRPVTDWAHYSHMYTSNILNVPYTDSLAYAKSSPIYYAEGLKGSLLICHGMVDVNVHFQDAVRLSQRLIELGKDNWELAIYPMEDHGFVEASSWTDEYKRILKLFETTLKK